MKITKFVHACLLVVTDADQTILVDPGQFSWESGLFEVDTLQAVDAVVVTHEHFDHYYVPFVQAILQKFPEVTFVSTLSVIGQLHELGVTRAGTDSLPGIEVFSRKAHASLGPMGETPENIAVHIDNRLTIGGDRHDLEESKEILALTVTAPWGAMTDAAAMALRLRPQTIIPVHDWHWSEAARNSTYDRLEGMFAQHNIRFIKLTDGQEIELQTDAN